MRTIPIMLGAAGLRAVVVGGGSVGLRKAKALRKAGAEVKLVDPGLSAARRGASEKAAAAAGIRVLPVPYRRSLLRRARLVMACTDNRQLNHRIAADARREGALVNAADQPEDCDFFLPAVVADGDVVIAIGTGGQAPALAASLRRKLAAALPRGVGRFAAALSRLRLRLKNEVPDSLQRMAILRELAGRESYRRFLAGGTKAMLAGAGKTIRPGRRRP